MVPDLCFKTFSFLHAASASWYKYSRRNCFEGNGADNISPDPFSNSLPLPDCLSACEEDEFCEGIVMDAALYSNDTGKEINGKCMKRKHIELVNCKTDPAYNTFIKTTGESKTS